MIVVDWPVLLGGLGLLFGILIWSMPKFFSSMPKPKEGKWIACVMTTSPFRPQREVWTIEFNGLWRAYVAARLMALWEDIGTPDCDGGLGIEWGIRKAGHVVFVGQTEKE